ncbi:CBS domain-containing protein [Ferruginibacter lapsinanis]|uniref:CBS domain-containing protein n=1 Tax=Ferruginibacter lapsinanis TaxID=563172 RepID=UPI001E3C6E38|nr:CBS domain-containing protein [Ferruginibacter lapsinanis]UEG50505.1 CBS domain-containing protein [Ferruginibacter lapsinanis]
MLTAELINHNIPQLTLQDSIGKALQLIQDFRISHLPVVSEEKYLGLISEEDLSDAEDKKGTIEVLQDSFITASIFEKEHFLNAVNFCIKIDTNVVPIINTEMELTGVITVSDLLKTLGNFSGANEIGGIIVLEMERSEFIISEISRIVESNDATILHLNTTVHPENGLLTVTLHLNKKEIATIIATFERYEYTVTFSYGNETHTTNIESNYQHLMTYLDL